MGASSSVSRPEYSGLQKISGFDLEWPPGVTPDFVG